MCGILAIYNRSRPIVEAKISNGLRALHHRGPDFAGHWVSADRRVALGHTLLAVTDLAGGFQPIIDVKRSRAITVNGEFYDWWQHRRELEALGYHFETKSDSELALHMHHRYGAACMERLRGEFAFVIWDENQQSLFAARDRYGICPLLYAEHDGAIYLASEAKSLFAMGVPAVWDQEAVYLQMHGLLPPDRTLFAGVRPLPPGHSLTIDSGGIRVQRYWDIDLPHENERAASTLSLDPSDLRERVLEAVRVRVPGKDVSWGLYLSGGLDSSAVAGIVAREYGHQVNAYTARFDHASYDESKAARRTAKELGHTLVEVDTSQERLADVFDLSIIHTESLASNSAPAGKLLLSRQARADGLRVVLTGEGADEVFAGYEELWPGPAEWRDDARLAYGYQLLADLPLWIGGSVLRGIVDRGLLSAEFLAHMGALDPLRTFLDSFDIAGKVHGRQAVDQSLYLWDRSVFANYLLRALGDGCERANSIEARLPLLDHPLTEFVAGFAVQHAPQAPGQTKALLREAVRPYITDEVYNGVKWPFVAPPASTATDGALMTRLGDILNSQALESLPFTDPVKVRARFDALRKPSTGQFSMMNGLAEERSLQRIASACVLQRHFAVNEGTSA